MQNRTGPNRGPQHPVFRIVMVDQGRSLIWLTREASRASDRPFSHAYVKAVSAGIEKGSPRFRAACAALLGMPVSDLFHGVSDASQPEGDPTTGSDSDRADTVVAASVPA